MEKLKKIYKSILFDAGYTLFEAHPPSQEVYCKFCKQEGIDISPEEMLEVMNRVWYENFLPLNAEDSQNFETDDEDDKKRWNEFCHEVFREVGFKDDVDPLVDEVYQFYASAKAWRLYPEVKEVIATLKQRGLFLGIVSNWNSSLPQICSELGVSPYLDLIMASALEGVRKPGTLIFEKALHKSNSPPEQTVYIGDTYEIDVLGAQSAGIDAILIDRASYYSDVSCPVIKDLRQLLPMLR